jgi:subtilisin family serine protease
LVNRNNYNGKEGEGQRMKKVIFSILALILASCGSYQTTGVTPDTSGSKGASSAAASRPNVTAESILSTLESGGYVKGELMVKFRSGTSPDKSMLTHQTLGTSVLERYSLIPNLEHIKLPDGLPVRDAVIKFMADPNVVYAEPNYVRKINSVNPVFPNDTYFGNQYGLNNSGTYAGGFDDADIDAPEAWGISTGSHRITIAVIDTGIDYNHSDLVNNVWENTGETSCVDEIDNDGNGYVDDCRGWDFVTCDEFELDESFLLTCKTPKAEDNDPLDDHGHGTHVSGIAGASGNNGEGVSGVMWNVKMMALKAFSFLGFGTDADIVNAINYAAANGARVINASFGGLEFSAAVYDSINAAHMQGVLFVASAGNGSDDGVGDNNDLMPAYPASYNLPNIIAVAATDQRDDRVPFSNFGPLSVDVAAPGVYIFNTVPNWWSQFFGFGILEFFQGTSMSSPHVAGLAGLLFDYYDGIQNTAFNHMQVRETILRGVDVLPQLQGWISTGGRINAYMSLSSLITPSDLTAKANDVKTATVNNPTPVDPSITLTWSDNASGEDGYSIERSMSGGGFAQIADVAADTTTFTDSNLSPATEYAYRIMAYNSISNSFYSAVAAAITKSAGSGGGGGGCSIVAGESAPVDVLIVLIPVALIFTAFMRRKR